MQEENTGKKKTIRKSKKASIVLVPEEQEQEQQQEQQQQEQQQQQQEQKKEKPNSDMEELKKEFEMNECGAPIKRFDKNCNSLILKKELVERTELAKNPEDDDYLYPSLNDPNFILKITEKKEFSDTRYDGKIYEIKEHAEVMSNAEFELAPHQAFVRNFLSFQTPYNSLLLYHGLGTGKTSSAIGVCEEQRDYLKQIGISKRIIIVASPNVQDNFRLQTFDERKLKLVDGLWTLKGATGNKFLKEINPMNMKGLTKERVVSQVKNIINSSYLFLGYIEFANYIEKIKEVKGSFKDEDDKRIKMIRNLKYEFDNRLIVIDEIHNVRIAEENKNKKVALQLLELVKSASNMRLLLLSATPMYNSYKEIIWLLNLMNLNDRRATIEIKDVFDKDGNFKKGENGEEEGKELLIRKATGYVSFVRGENPYIFPFRVYPSVFSPDTTFETLEYPRFQMNGKKIKPEDRISVLKSTIYLTNIGRYQSLGYKFIIDSLRKHKITTTTKTGVVRDMPSFENMEAFGYTLLQIPIEALNIVYPIEGLEYVMDQLTPISMVSEGELDEEQEREPPSNKKGKQGNQLLVKPDLTGAELPEYRGKRLQTLLEPQDESVHKIELTRKPSSEESITTLRGGVTSSSSRSNSSGNSDQSGKKIFISSSDLTGKKGLDRVMDFIDSKNPPEKGSFQYKKWLLDKDIRMFSPDKIGDYSSKIKSICRNIVSDDGVVSDGIILIYSQYIDGGLIPVALALEEMGFTRYGDGVKSLFKAPPTEPVDSRTMKPRINKKDTFMPAKYIMITGDSRLSPNNDFEVKAVTGDDNADGHKIKVVLISQAGSEGVDFKCLRQVHIIDPWYNMNRIEQIIGRGVRNLSHKNLDFEKRNVELFVYGTILENNEEEAADLYVYRLAEYKAIQMGKVSRLLKETSVDCLLNHDQVNFTQENIEENTKKDIKQVLSNGAVINDFKVGDVPFTSACDYMDTCEYKCIPTPEKPLMEDNAREDTYNEAFIMMNSEKIFQKIRKLFSDKVDGKFFYKKSDLIRVINVPKPYPIVQIYAVLTQLIEDTNEHIMDKYGRTGHLVNIGEYYLFQPSELNNKGVSIFDRSVPLDYKHKMVNFEIKSDILNKKIEVPLEERKVKELEQGEQKGEQQGEQKGEQGEQQGDEQKEKGEEPEEQQMQKLDNHILDEITMNYKLTMYFANGKDNINRGDDNWYKHCGVTIRKLIANNIMTMEDAKKCLIEHLIDMLMYSEKLEILNYLYSIQEFDDGSLEYRMKQHFNSKIIRTKRETSIILFLLDKLQVMLLKNKRWVKAEPEDEREVAIEFAKNSEFSKYQINNLIGFIGLDVKNRYMVFKVKDMEAKRNTGARCDESSKPRKIAILKEIMGDDIFDTYTNNSTKGLVQPELCSLEELLFRNLNRIKKNNKIWFFDFESALLYKNELKT